MTLIEPDPAIASVVPALTSVIALETVRSALVMAQV